MHFNRAVRHHIDNRNLDGVLQTWKQLKDHKAPNLPEYTEMLKALVTFNRRHEVPTIHFPAKFHLLTRIVVCQIERLLNEFKVSGLEPDEFWYTYVVPASFQYSQSIHFRIISFIVLFYELLVNWETEILPPV